MPKIVEASSVVARFVDDVCTHKVCINIFLLILLLIEKVCYFKDKTRKIIQWENYEKEITENLYIKYGSNPDWS